MKRALDFADYAERAREMSDIEIHYALVDIGKTLPAADSMDRAFPGNNDGGYYRDCASVLRAEMRARSLVRRT